LAKNQNFGEEVWSKIAKNFGHPNLANRNGGNNKHILIKIFINLLDV